MLNAAGIEAYPVLISTSDSLEVQEDLPTLLFNHAIAATRIGEKLVFMDVTASTTSFSDLPLGDQDRTTLVFFKDGAKLIKTPLFEPDHNKILTTMKIKLNEDESIDAARQVQADGVFLQAQRYWLTYTMPALIEEELKQKSRSIADKAVLKTYEIKNADDLNKPVLLEYSFSAPQYLVRAGKARIMDHFGGIDTSMLVKDTRRYPIEIAGLALQEDRIEVELPAHLAVKYLPTPVEVDTKWFYFSSKYEIVDRNVIHYSFVNKIKERIIPVSEYGEYKKSMEDIATLINQQVVLEEKK